MGCGCHLKEEVERQKEQRKERIVEAQGQGLPAEHASKVKC